MPNLNSKANNINLQQTSIDINNSSFYYLKKRHFEESI